MNNQIKKIYENYLKGYYIAKGAYYRDIMSIVKDFAILSLESAIENFNMTNGNFSEKVTVYSLIDLPEPFLVKRVTHLENIDKELIHGFYSTTLERTFNDLLSDEDTDPQILMESLGKYYYKHNSSFKDLNIYECNLNRFNELKEDAIHYWDEF